MRRLTVIVLTLTLLAVLSAACGKPTLPPPPTLDFSATRAAGGATTPRPTATAAPTTKVTTPQAGNETSTPEIAATRPITTSSAPGKGGWAYRADMMVAMFSLHALNCERQAQGLAPVAYPEDNRLGKELTEAVKQAVGYDESRKDSVSVECVEFKERQPVLPPEVLAGDQRWGLILKVAKHASTVVVLGAFLLVVRSMLKKARAAREAREAELAAAREAQARQAAAAAQRTGQVSLRERVGAAVAANPDAAADLLKAWYKGVGTTSQAE